ncbi:MAG: hypothetical protein OJF47_003555 [Nitrospira sp.]|jgi:hypothetical protein|nr:MAG: hypothetical protein OJF47_003555 [Nitrospira sp.]
MESLDFVVLFSVVVMTWVGRVVPVCVSVRQMIEKSVMGREQMGARRQWCAFSPVPVAVSDKRVRLRRLCKDRRIDSGRGRPPLYVN